MKAERAGQSSRTSRTTRGLVCPGCGHRDLHVAYTRHRVDAIVRVRRCQQCARRVVTHERLVGR
jgi:transcriptional regulator NrdR family protein